VTNGYQIKDVADRSGFSAATLRYYEGIGLLPESTRSPAGYRLYDERTLDRLAFIARAKQLGCSLDEIADLTVAWEGGQCGPVQDRLRAVVADKLASARQQIVELVTLTSDLEHAAGALEQHRPEGPCDDQCGCVSYATLDRSPEPLAVTLISKPVVVDDVDIACTLAPQSMKGRLADWQEVLGHVVSRERTDGGVRATFASGAPLSQLIQLTAAEQDCCQFFNFAITVDSRGVALEVSAPTAALPVLHSLFGAPE
jgi:MerR family copper efflux transcriptional regulator